MHYQYVNILYESTPAKAARISPAALFSWASRSKRKASRTTSLGSSNSPDFTWLLTNSSKADGNVTFITFSLPRRQRVVNRFCRVELAKGASPLCPRAESSDAERGSVSRSKLLKSEHVRHNRGNLIFGYCCGSQTRAPPNEPAILALSLKGGLGYLSYVSFFA